MDEVRRRLSLHSGLLLLNLQGTLLKRQKTVGKAKNSEGRIFVMLSPVSAVALRAVADLLHKDWKVRQSAATTLACLVKILTSEEALGFAIV